MSEYSGNIRDLPVVTGGHFIENSTKKIVFGPDGRFWNDAALRIIRYCLNKCRAAHREPRGILLQSRPCTRMTAIRTGRTYLK